MYSIHILRITKYQISSLKQGRISLSHTILRKKTHIQLWVTILHTGFQAPLLSVSIVVQVSIVVSVPISVNFLVSVHL